MAQGDATATLVENATPSSVATAAENLRVTANDKWLMTSINNGQDVLIVNIEEV